jgi:putative transposase
MDFFSKEIVGWNISGRHTKELVLNTVLDAIKNQNLKLPRVIHSDQGSEYNCKDYVNFLNYLGIQISMSKKKSLWENAHQESFYANFKTDLRLEFDRFNTMGELIEAIHKTINYYNQERIHVSLKMPPAKFKQKYLEKTV